MDAKWQTVIVGTISSTKLVDFENYDNLGEVSIVLDTDMVLTRRQAIV